MSARLVYGLVASAGWLMARFPVFLLYPLGRFLGRLWCRANPDRKVVAARNLELCFPNLDETARSLLLQQTIDATGMALVEAVLGYWASDRRLRRMFTAQGQEQLHDQLQKEEPLLIYLAHYTSGELACRLINLVSPKPIAIVARRNANSVLESAVDQARCRHAGCTIAKKDTRQLLRLLRSNTPVMYAFDQHFSTQTVWSNFFGVPAVTLSSAAKLAAHSQARVMSFWCARVADGRYQLQIDPVWPDYPGGDEVKDADRYNQWIEAKVRQNPEQYLWVHRRFRQTEIDGENAYQNSARRGKHKT